MSECIIFLKLDSQEDESWMKEGDPQLFDSKEKSLRFAKKESSLKNNVRNFFRVRYESSYRCLENIFYRSSCQNV